MREPHIIYGYRCKTGRMAGKWKIGCTLQEQNKNRHSDHRKAQSGVRLFDRYLNARIREGYSYDDVFEYFQLRVLVCTRQDAEIWERIYTDRYDALSPNGFNLVSGMYKGRKSEETKRRLSEAGLNRSPEKMAKMNAAARKTRAATRKRKREVRRKEMILNNIKKQKRD